jgi:folate-binding protein YgfZ
MVPVETSRIREGYDAAHRGAALIDRADRGLILVSGKDRASYLQGLLTNDVVALRPGTGCYAAYLTPQGRMITDVRVYELGDVILLSLPALVKDTVLVKLDSLVFTEDVQLGDVTDSFVSLAIVGPAAASAAGAGVDAGSDTPLDALPEHGNVRAQFAGQPVIVLRITDAGVPGYELIVDRQTAPALRAALAGQGAVEIDRPTAETLRIEAGIPRFHADMDEDTIPLEAGIESSAISLNKGCYVGQEVIIRVLHRGHGRVARKLAGLTIEGTTVPERDAVVQADGREIGRVTSGVASPALDRPIALAYLHRDFVAPGTRVAVSGFPAIVTALPFVSPDKAVA